ncbi:hypothetical protein VTK56DRAFT_6675 [Thermocarpiscus australiensis]
MPLRCGPCWWPSLTTISPRPITWGTRFLPSSVPCSRPSTPSLPGLWACVLAGSAAACVLADSYSVYLRVLLSVVIAAVNITMLAPYSIEFTRAATAAAQLFKPIDRASAIDPFDRSGEQPTHVTGLVEFENVTFCYPTRPGIKVLDDFSLKVPAGKVTALGGPKRFRQKHHRWPDGTMVQSILGDHQARQTPNRPAQSQLAPEESGWSSRRA